MPGVNDGSSGRPRSNGVTLSRQEAAHVWKDVTQTPFQRLKARLNPWRSSAGQRRGAVLARQVATIQDSVSRSPHAYRGSAQSREAVRDLGKAQYEMHKDVRAKTLLRSEIEQSSVSGAVSFARNTESAGAAARRVSRIADVTTLLAEPTVAATSAAIGQGARIANTALQAASGGSWAAVSMGSRKKAEGASSPEAQTLHSHIADYADVKVARRQKGAVLGFAGIDMGAADVADDLLKHAAKGMGGGKGAKGRAAANIGFSTMALLDHQEDIATRKIQGAFRNAVANRKAAGVEKIQKVVRAAVEDNAAKKIQGAFRNAILIKRATKIREVVKAAVEDKAAQKSAQQMHSAFVAQSGAKTMGARFNEWRGKPSTNTQIQRHLLKASTTSNRQERQAALEQAKNLSAVWQKKRGGAGSNGSGRGQATESLKQSITKLGK